MDGGDWGHISLFLDVLSTTQSPARALQAWLTTLNQMKYYNSVSRFSAKSEATYMFSTAVLVPSRWLGFIAVVAMTAVHVLLTLCIVVWYLLGTDHTMLGNSWQAVAQVVSDKTLPLLKKATNTKDTEVEELIQRGQGTRQKYSIIKSKTTGRLELVAVP